MGMVGEYKKHYGTIAVFPVRNDIWRDDAIHMQKYMIELVKIVAKYEPVLLFCKTGYLSKLHGLPNNVQIVECNYDDIWARDIGPTFIDDGRMECIDWKFNAWGGKKEGSYYPWYEDDAFASFVAFYLNVSCKREERVIIEGGGITTDGDGTIVATRSVLLNRNRNPFKKKEVVENIILEATNSKRMMWIEQGLAMDETNGHIDNLLSFINSHEVCLAWTEDKKNPNYSRVRKAYSMLEGEYKIYKIPLPPMQYMLKSEADGLLYHEGAIRRNEGDILPASYINYYMVNGAVIIPSFGCDTDIEVKHLFENIFADREVVQVYSREPLLGGGGIHCLLHEIPYLGKEGGVVKSVLNPKVEVKTSGIDKRGIFAKEDIQKGEIVFIKGGHILTRKQVFTSSAINSYLPISDEYFIGAATPDEEEAVKLYNNHSCDPNCGLHGEITFIAIRDIKAGEELTVDYAFIDNEDYEFVCGCGSENCRGKITGYDWKIKEIQEKYYPYFAKYLKEKMIARTK